MFTVYNDLDKINFQRRAKENTRKQQTKEDGNLP